MGGLEGDAGTSDKGTYVMWYGELKCLHGSINESTGKFEFVFPEGECDDWGSSRDRNKKRVWCKQYSYRNCYDHTLKDNGRYTYTGRKTTSLTGKQCQNWENTTWFKDEQYGNENYGIYENV